MEIECEGFVFQPFTPQGAFVPLSTWLPTIVRCEGFIFQPFTSIHRQCEGLDFKAFTPQEAFILLSSLLLANFQCEGFVFQPFTSVHRQCEHLKILAFTLKTIENQQRTNSVWRSECFFREIKYVYAHAIRSIYQTGYDFLCGIYLLRLLRRTLREVLFTSRRQFRRTRRVEKRTPGLFGKAYHTPIFFISLTLYGFA